MEKCERCGSLEEGREYTIEDLYTANICIACSNDWVMYILHHDITLIMKNLYTRMEFLLAFAAQSHNNLYALDDHFALNAELLQKKQDLVHIIKDWVAGNE